MEKINGQSARYNQIVQLRKKTRVANQRANTTAWLALITISEPTTPHPTPPPAFSFLSTSEAGRNDTVSVGDAHPQQNTPV
ncbi:hypothetical protein, partial [Escherichia coli]|uniref:hypothetical protein n=1 Tax=Escherichia coli TaxID=562 RepID=UPI00197B0013